MRVLPVHDVVSSQGNRIDPFTQLDLKVYQPAVTECRLAAGKIKLPHVAEPLVV